jgi:UDP-glucose 4-epimerase
MSKALVIGEGGLLGSHLRSELQSQGFSVFSHAQSFSWEDAEMLSKQFQFVIEEFAKTVNSGEDWSIYWSAGISTMHSSEQDLLKETYQFNEFIQVTLKSGLDLSKGVLIFSSSAGAVYAGSKERLITEHSPVAPINPYGLEKLKQEKLLATIMFEYSELTILIARISTLYGVRNRRSSRQGLLAQISRNVVLNQPIHIYVPLETMRDYIHAQDAALCIIKTVRVIQNKGGGIFTKIVAYEKTHSIADIMGIFKRMSHKNLRTIHYAIPSTEYYKRNAQLRSVNFIESSKTYRRNLLIGISQLIQYDRTHLANRVMTTVN